MMLIEFFYRKIETKNNMKFTLSAFIHGAKPFILHMISPNLLTIYISTVINTKFSIIAVSDLFLKGILLLSLPQFQRNVL